MYKFIRYSTRIPGKTIKSNWMFIPQSKQDVIDFYNKYTCKICDKEIKQVFESIRKNADNNLVKNSTKMLFDCDHPTSPWQQALDILINFSSENKSPLYNMIKIQKDIYDSRLDIFNKGVVLMYDEDGMRSIPYIEDIHNIIDEKMMSTIEFPKLHRPSKDDIRIISWPGGNHYYAKVGNEDVVVDGVQKWNTREEAVIAAKQYIDNL